MVKLFILSTCNYADNQYLFKKNNFKNLKCERFFSYCHHINMANQAIEFMNDNRKVLSKYFKNIYMDLENLSKQPNYNLGKLLKEKKNFLNESDYILLQIKTDKSIKTTNNTFLNIGYSMNRWDKILKHNEYVYSDYKDLNEKLFSYNYNENEMEKQFETLYKKLSGKKIILSTGLNIKCPGTDKFGTFNDMCDGFCRKMTEKYNNVYYFEPSYCLYKDYNKYWIREKDGRKSMDHLSPLGYKVLAENLNNFIESIENESIDNFNKIFARKPYIKVFSLGSRFTGFNDIKRYDIIKRIYQTDKFKNVFNNILFLNGTNKDESKIKNLQKSIFKYNYLSKYFIQSKYIILDLIDDSLNCNEFISELKKICNKLNDKKIVFVKYPRKSKPGSDKPSKLALLYLDIFKTLNDIKLDNLFILDLSICIDNVNNYSSEYHKGHKKMIYYDKFNQNGINKITNYIYHFIMELELA